MRLDSGYFYHAVANHNWDTGKTLAIAENLSLERGLRQFLWLTSGADGQPQEDPYNRFPVGSKVLVKLAMLPFEGDLAAKISAARVVMLAMFASAVALAFHACARSWRAAGRH